MAALQSPLGEEGEAGRLPLREARARFERQYILDRLAANEGSLSRTARTSGSNAPTSTARCVSLGSDPRPAPSSPGVEEVTNER